MPWASSSRPVHADRLRCGAGLEQSPVWTDPVTFRFPTPPANYTYAGRLVVTEYAHAEIWSPNSTFLDFYPGRAPPKSEHNTPSPRYDGTLGRFDPTIFPQAYDPDMPWLAFAPYELGSINDGWPEFFSLLSDQYWNAGITKSLTTALRSRNHDIDKRMDRARRDDLALPKDQRIISSPDPRMKRSGTLWELRPIFPTEGHVSALEGIVDYQECVDALRRVQDGLRFKYAWCKYAELRLRLPTETTFSLRNRNIQLCPSPRFFVGVWLTAVSEFDAMLFLTTGLAPCFVLHMYSEQDQYSSPSSSLPLRTFISASEREEYFTRSFCNPYEREALHHGLRLLELTDLPDSEVLPESHRGACSTFIDPLTHPNAQGYRLVPANRRSSTSHFAIIRTEESTFSAPAPSRPTSYEDVFEYKGRRLSMSRRLRSLPAPTLSQVQLTNPDGSSFIWIQPPPVAALKPGPWTKWIVEEDDDEFDPRKWIVRQVGKKSKLTEDYPFVNYDRENLREIYFPHDFVFTADEGPNNEGYGRAAPRLRYFRPEDKHPLLRQVPPSHWMYPDRKPSSPKAGAVVDPPTTRQPEPSSPWVGEDDDDDDGFGYGPATVYRDPQGQLRSVQDDTSVVPVERMSEDDALAAYHAALAPSTPLPGSNLPSIPEPGPPMTFAKTPSLEHSTENSLPRDPSPSASTLATMGTTNVTTMPIKEVVTKHSTDSQSDPKLGTPAGSSEPLRLDISLQALGNLTSVAPVTLASLPPSTTSAGDVDPASSTTPPSNFELVPPTPGPVGPPDSSPSGSALSPTSATLTPAHSIGIPAKEIRNTLSMCNRLVSPSFLTHET
ncbi:hypothetical protein PTI98_007195 [Pleurotus ostreatus]|nr:hypothetical protein PTI98_007195 [Pleurotus ostreatus]